jgi:AcrR family transcriptional regulator
MPRVTDAHRERRRRQILDAAVVCFDRKGLHGTATDDIVAEAGLSAGAIYRYFDSKEAIIEAVAAERHDRERSLLAHATATGDLRASIQAFVDGYLEWLSDPEEQRRRRVNVHVWAEALHNPRLRAIVASGLAPLHDSVHIVEDAVRAGTFPTTIDLESFVRAILALLQGLVLQQAWDLTIDLQRYGAAVLTMIDALLDAGRRPGAEVSQRQPSARIRPGSL